MLIFLPFLGALVCLIARGRGMSESQMADVRRAQSETNAYLKQVARRGGGKSPTEHIAGAKTLPDDGTMTTSAEHAQRLDGQWSSRRASVRCGGSADTAAGAVASADAEPAGVGSAVDFPVG